MGKVDSTPLGTSLKFPLELDGTGSFKTVSGADAVGNHIRAIISAVRGSHRMEPWYGVPRLPFRPVSYAPALAEIIKLAIIRAEDRIDPENLIVYFSDAAIEAGWLPLHVNYVVDGQAKSITLARGYRVIAS